MILVQIVSKVLIFVSLYTETRSLKSSTVCSLASSTCHGCTESRLNLSNAENFEILLQVLTNAKYKSVSHRAVVNSTKSRISLVYFWVPLTTIDIVPSPDLVDEENPCKYNPFNFETMTKMKQMYFLNTLDHFLRGSE